MDSSQLLDFISDTQWDTLPEVVRRQLIRALGDLLGSMIGGLRTPMAGILAGYAARVLPGNEATVAGIGKVCSAPGAALANGGAANALDIDDGYRPSKGHPGAVIIPAALAQAEAIGASGARFLSAVAIGYEVGLRCAVAWHGSRPAYHGTGSWGAVGAAAACASLLRLGRAQTQEALGVAEYHGPLAPVMTAVEYPGMVKDGIEWGTFVGITSAQLAQAGFTGIPPFLSFPAHRDRLATLGQEWYVLGLYFKFFPCCRWAQPAIEGVLRLRAAQGIAPEAVAKIVVSTFSAATHLGTRHPRNTEEAQYSLAFPVACAVARGRVTVEEITGDGLADPAVNDLADRVEMIVDPTLEERFPAEALARVTVELADGRSYSIGPLAAPGDAHAPPSEEELRKKFAALTVPVLGKRQAEQLRQCILGCAELDDLGQLTRLLVRR